MPPERKHSMKKIGLVGCGRISKRHIEAIAETPGVEITYVCDKNEEKARKTAEELGVPYVTDYRELNGKGLDVISVLTPSGLHPRHVCNIAEQTDAPYIVCEKPLSLTVREAFEVFRRIEKANKVLLPVFQNRYNPLVKLMKDLIDSGKLGKIHQFICNVLWNRNDEYFAIDWHGTAEFDGGVLYTQASHYVDMVHYFFGDIESYKGLGSNMRGFDVQDSVSAVLKFKSGTVGSINATGDVFQSNFATEFTLIGQKGTIRLSGTNLNQIDYWNVEGLEKPDMDFKIDHQYGKGHNTMYEYIAADRFDMFPSKADVLSGIRLMEMLSY